MPTFENLLYEVSGGVATITVNRPKVGNALNRATLGELEAAFTAVSASLTAMSFATLPRISRPLAMSSGV